MPDEVKTNHAPAVASDPRSPAVLVIDDDKSLLRSLDALLGSYGIRIVVARDGLEGLKLFREISPAVVLTDIIMPEQDGIGAIVQMRRERPGVKIIAMSGGGRVGNSDFLTIAKKLGANSVIHKPFDVDELVATIRQHLASGG